VQDFSLGDVFVQVQIHPEEEPLQALFDRYVQRFLKRGKAPWYCWFRSKDRRWVYVFDRTKFVKRLGDRWFLRLLDNFQTVLGRFSQRGFLVHLEEESLIVACSVKGLRKNPRVTDSRVCKVRETDTGRTVIEVEATNDQTLELAHRLLYGD